jgi:biopolymer transport protein ExbD
MLRRHHYRRRGAEQAELDMTTFLNLMVVLVPFLLITAVFSRIAVVELSMPTTAGGPNSQEPTVKIEVVVRDAGLELLENEHVIAQIPQIDGAYDLPGLSERVLELKRKHPGHDAASVLLEPDIEYDHLIQVMDTVRVAERPVEGRDEIQRIVMFTNIAIGDAP